MKKTLKILFATDFSSHSRLALHLLMLIRKKFRTDIFLIHVISSFWRDWLASGLCQKEAEQRLQVWQKELTGKLEKKKLFVKLGNRADTVLSKAEILNVDLVVLGSKNITDKGRYKSGTTVNDVVRNAKSSVLVFKNEKISKIVCGVDGSPSSAKALNWAIQYAQHFEAKLTILSVIPKISAAELGMEEEEISKEEITIEKENVKKIDTFLK